MLEPSFNSGEAGFEVASVGCSSHCAVIASSGSDSDGGDVVAISVAMGGVGIVAAMVGEEGGELGRGVDKGDSG
jgi:hypothetical protein